MILEMRVQLNENRSWYAGDSLRFVPAGTLGAIVDMDSLSHVTVRWDHGLAGGRECFSCAAVIPRMEESMVPVSKITFLNVVPKENA